MFIIVAVNVALMLVITAVIVSLLAGSIRSSQRVAAAEVSVATPPSHRRQAARLPTRHAGRARRPRPVTETA